MYYKLLVVHERFIIAQASTMSYLAVVCDGLPTSRKNTLCIMILLDFRALGSSPKKQPGQGEHRTSTGARHAHHPLYALNVPIHERYFKRTAHLIPMD